MKYTFDVKFTGYEQMTVEAKSRREAVAKVVEVFEAKYKKAPAWDLRTKSTDVTQLGGEKP